MAVDVSVAELVHSYASLRDTAGQAVGPGGRLLSFYSVECGLMAAYLGKRGIKAPDTRSLPLVLRSHDLRRLAKKLRLSSAYPAGLSACRSRQTRQNPVDLHELHEAWRYGVPLHEGDEKSILGTLGRLSEWCREEHRK